MTERQTYEQRERSITYHQQDRQRNRHEQRKVKTERQTREQIEVPHLPLAKTAELGADLMSQLVQTRVDVVNINQILTCHPHNSVLTLCMGK